MPSYTNVKAIGILAYLRLTLRDWEDAWYIQSACNFSGVAYGLCDAIKKVRDEAAARKLGWDWADRHPIVILISDKIASMCGTQDCGSDKPVWKAYDILEVKTR